MNRTPFIPSFSPSGGEGARRAVEGEADDRPANSVAGIFMNFPARARSAASLATNSIPVPVSISAMAKFTIVVRFSDLEKRYSPFVKRNSGFVKRWSDFDKRRSAFDKRFSNLEIPQK